MLSHACTDGKNKPIGSKCNRPTLYTRQKAIRFNLNPVGGLHDSNSRIPYLAIASLVYSRNRTYD